VIIRKFKVMYICSNYTCRLPMTISSVNFTKSKDVTQIWTELSKDMNTCYSCKHPMEIRAITCKITTDIFGTDLKGEWICQAHAHKSFFPIPLRRAYYNLDQYYIQPAYREISKMGFPWKCPTCKEPMAYVDKRDARGVG